MSGEDSPSPRREPESERRVAPRLPSTLRVSCYPAGSGVGDRRQARVRNISRTGMGLVVDRRWDPGTTLILDLPVGEAPRPSRARVVHATAQPGGLFLIGCVLETPLSEEEIQELAR
jgi:hypothetical protein